MAHRLIKTFIAASIFLGTACSESKEPAKVPVKAPAQAAAQPAKSAASVAAPATTPATAAPATATPTAPAAPAAPAATAEPAPVYEVGKDGKRAHIDFSLAPNSISVPGMQFHQFANRKLMIFYFSAKCPHCQHAVGYVQKLADELAPQGFTAVAISVKFNSEEEVRGFIGEYKVRMPVFQDAGTFGTGYGTGSIPLLFLVNEKGEYIRYKTFSAEQTPALMKAESARMAAK
jgi:thiol-disulfide isomerase/thioredoxin